MWLVLIKVFLSLQSLLGIILLLPMSCCMLLKIGGIAKQFMALKLDTRKEYDKVDWACREATIRRLGFEKFIFFSYGSN